MGRSRKLKQLGSAKGAEAELPEPIEVETKPFSSQELKMLNPPVGNDGDAELVGGTLVT